MRNGHVNWKASRRRRNERASYCSLLSASLFFFLRLTGSITYLTHAAPSSCGRHDSRHRGKREELEEEKRLEKWLEFRRHFFFHSRRRSNDDASNLVRQLVCRQGPALLSFRESSIRTYINYANLSTQPYTWRDDPCTRRATETARFDAAATAVVGEPNLSLVFADVAFDHCRVRVSLPLESRFVGLGLYKLVSQHHMAHLQTPERERERKRERLHLQLH